MVYLSPAVLRYICLTPTRGTCVSIKPLDGIFGSNCPVASLSQAGLRWHIVSGRHVVYLFPIALSYICLQPTCGIFVSRTAIRSPSVLWHFCLRPTCGTFVTGHPAVYLSQADLRYICPHSANLRYICLRPSSGIFVSSRPVVYLSPAVLWYICLQPSCGKFIIFVIFVLSEPVP